MKSNGCSIALNMIVTTIIKGLKIFQEVINVNYV